MSQGRDPDTFLLLIAPRAVAGLQAERETAQQQAENLASQLETLTQQAAEAAAEAAASLEAAEARGAQAQEKMQAS